MPKRRKIQIKKAACLSDRLHFLAILTKFLQQIAAYLPEFIPQATTSYRYFCG
jgi:hypothetical protein